MILKMPALEPSEKEIQNSILDWLQLQPHCLAWPTASVGLYDPIKKIHRRPAKHFRRGLSDVIGIWRGAPLAIEVKTRLGRATHEQKLFIHEFVEQGGIGFIARSLEDVINALNFSDDSRGTSRL